MRNQSKMQMVTWRATGHPAFTSDKQGTDEQGKTELLSHWSVEGWDEQMVTRRAAGDPAITSAACLKEKEKTINKRKNEKNKWSPEEQLVTQQSPQPHVPNKVTTRWEGPQSLSYHLQSLGTEKRWASVCTMCIAHWRLIKFWQQSVIWRFATSVWWTPLAAFKPS